MDVEGFIRPDERAKGAPTKCPEYSGQPDPKQRRPPTAKDGVWRLQSEYEEGRVGRNRVENSKLWDCALWILRLYETAERPADATRALSLITTPLEDEISADSIDGDTESLNVLYELPGYVFEVLYIMDMVKALDRCERTKPAPPGSERDRPVFDSRLEAVELRVEASEMLEKLKVRMGSLWKPVKLAVIDRVELHELGTTQGVGRDLAGAVGRQRVIEGLRIAASLRKGMAESQRGLGALLMDRSILDTIELGSVLAGLRPVRQLSRLIPANDNHPGVGARRAA